MGATDSKLVFRKSVFRLFEENNIPVIDNDYWSMFWTLPESIRDVYNLVDPSDIVKTRDGAMENLETLLDKLIDHLNEQIHSDKLETNEILNCCRIITRIMPFLFEKSEYMEWENTYFWTPKQNDDMCQGNRLISLVLEALFLPGFTLPSNLKRDDLKIPFVIWESGVGSSIPIGSSRENDWNRIEVLRLLLVLFSNREVYVNHRNHWLDYMIAELDKKVILAFLCSMLNTCCKFNPMSWTTDTKNPKDQLVAHCLHTLLVLLDYHSSSTHKADGNFENLFMNNRTEKEGNAFRYYISRLHRQCDLQFVMDGIHRVLSSPMQTLSTSTDTPKYYVEMTMLCWKLLEINHRFTAYIIQTERALDLMVMLLYYTNENKLQPYGPVRIYTYILQTLSSSTEFCLKINKPFNGNASLPPSMRIPNFEGSYADYLILTIYSLIVSSRGSLFSLYSTLVIIITNISPYVKNLSKLTSRKLVSLFSSLSAPAFLFADKDNHQYVTLLLEALNNIIDHQFENNPNLIYAIVQKHLKFQKLATLSLESMSSEVTISTEPMSDKAKSKLPMSDRTGMLLHRNSSTRSITIGKNDFTPTDDWIYYWRSKLPLQTILILIQEYLPKLETPNLTYYQICQVLKNAPALPSPQPIVLREFEWLSSVIIWFQSLLWSQILVTLKYNPWSNSTIQSKQYNDIGDDFYFS